MYSVIELSTWFTREFAETVRFHRAGGKYLVRLAKHLADVHQLDHIQRRQYLQEAKLQPKVKVVVYEREADNSGKITQQVLAIQCRHKKQCTNCQGHEEMKLLLKQKLKEQLQRTRQNRKKQRKSNSWLRGHREIV